ncbi:MAG: ceramidase domain-containing protein [Sideroxyarcus sp.]|nr:ceramidase domain-containing protein [Sideroxyarcus sp.]
MNRIRVALWAPACGVALALVLLPPLPQPQDYHRFADARAWLGVPNFLNVVSNLPILLVAVAGLCAVRQRSPGRAESLPYALFFLALAATACGSAWYHLAPDNARLFWDRLPIAVSFAMLLAAVVAERTSPKAGLLLAAPLAATGAGSVWYWLRSEGLGVGNVLPYFAFQFYALLAILLLMHYCPSRYSRGTDLYRMIALYGVALVAELLDRNFYAVGEFVSGHTLKHLLAALAAYQLVGMLHLRKRI